MGRTLEAIMRAEEESKKILTKTATTVEEKSWLRLPISSGSRVTSGQVDHLKTRLLRRSQTEKLKTIMFTGVSPGSGTTSTAVSLATLMAADGRVKVLLADANIRSPELYKIFNIKPNGGMCELLNEKGIKSFKFRKIGPGELFMMPCGSNMLATKDHFQTPRFDAFLKASRKMFDYVFLDAAPVSSYADPHAICSKVDGVVIVAPFGKTRRQVAERVKKELDAAGAKVLGVVINRRKYYIPQWVYKRL